jgi:DNA (cytosine-5)-methyltransferase 1
VFIVGHFGDWRFAAKVLFESESVRGDSPQGGEAGEGVAKATGDGTYLGNAEGGARSKLFLTGSNQCRGVNNQTPLIKILKPHIVNDRPAEFKWAGDISHGLRATDYKSLPVAFAQNQRGELRTSDVSPQLTTGGGKPGEGYPAVAFTHSGYSNKPAWITGQRTDCLPAGGQHPSSHQGIGVMEGMSVRRLTPRECERLQGFPDDWTRWGIDRKGNLKELADGPRYRMLGNAVTVNVSEWIGKRIMEAEKCES